MRRCSACHAVSARSGPNEGPPAATASTQASAATIKERVAGSDNFRRKATNQLQKASLNVAAIRNRLQT